MFTKIPSTKLFANCMIYHYHLLKAYMPILSLGLISKSLIREFATLKVFYVIY